MIAIETLQYERHVQCLRSQSAPIVLEVINQNTQPGPKARLRRPPLPALGLNDSSAARLDAADTRGSSIVMSPTNTLASVRTRTVLSTTVLHDQPRVHISRAATRAFSYLKSYQQPVNAVLEGATPALQLVMVEKRPKGPV